MTSLVQFAKALADPTRTRIVRCLTGGSVCVCELADALEVGMSTLSTHLQILKSAEVVTADKRSKWVSYQLDPVTVTPVKQMLQAFSGAEEHSARIRRDKHRLHRRLAMREGGDCCRGVGELERHLREKTMSNGTCECTCGCGCQNGEPCTCGECCNCGCDKACQCKVGGECTCGDDCKCAEKACKCQEGGECTCGDDCKCGQ